MKYIFLQGAPGSGKTTLAKALRDRLGWAHLDRDAYWDNRRESYREMHNDLRGLVKREEGAIVDAPFLFENDGEFRHWTKDLPAYLILYLDLPPLERKERRTKRGMLRDQVKNWIDLMAFEERWYRARPGSLRLDGSLPTDVLLEIILWHVGAEGRTIRRAKKDDLLAVQEFKDRILVESFSRFLTEDELEKERDQVASREAVWKLLEEDEVFLALRNNEIWGMLAATPIENDERLIFSGYSRGGRAVAALGTIILSQAIDEGLRCVRAVVYDENERSKKVLTSFGFQDSGGSHRNPLVPRLQVEHWRASLLGRK